MSSDKPRMTLLSSFEELLEGLLVCFGIIRVDLPFYPAPGSGLAFPVSPHAAADVDAVSPVRGRFTAHIADKLLEQG